MLPSHEKGRRFSLKLIKWLTPLMAQPGEKKLLKSRNQYQCNDVHVLEKYSKHYQKSIT